MMLTLQSVLSRNNAQKSLSRRLTNSFLITVILSGKSGLNLVT